MERIGRRLLLGLGLAALLAGALGYWLATDERPAAEQPTDAAPPPVPAVELPAGIPRGQAFVLYVAAPGAELPSSIAPVVGIDAAGGMRVLRPAPRPTAPQAEPWIAAGIELPSASVGRLSPDARASLLTLLREWRGALLRGTPRRAIGWQIIDPGAIESLARWER